jgi:hypothetical protein
MTPIIAKQVFKKSANEYLIPNIKYDKIATKYGEVLAITLASEIGRTFKQKYHDYTPKYPSIALINILLKVLLFKSCKLVFLYDVT